MRLNKGIEICLLYIEIFPRALNGKKEKGVFNRETNSLTEHGTGEKRYKGAQEHKFTGVQAQQRNCKRDCGVIHFQRSTGKHVRRSNAVILVRRIQKLGLA